MGEKRGVEKKGEGYFQKKGSLGEGRGRSPIAIKIQTEDREKKGEVKKKGEGYFKKKKGSLGDGRGRSPIAIKIQTEDREKKGMRIRKGEEVIRLPFLLHEEEEEA